jgi:hypothetical protein
MSSRAFTAKPKQGCLFYGLESLLSNPFFHAREECENQNPAQDQRNTDCETAFPAQQKRATLPPRV